MSLTQNAKNWKSTAVGIIAALAMILPFFLPNVSADDADVVKTNANVIVNAIEVIIQAGAAIWLIFKAKD